MTSIGQLIYEKRLAANMTQAELYASLPESCLQRPKSKMNHGGRSQISLIEAGHQMPTIKQLYAIANALGCPISDLIQQETL